MLHTTSHHHDLHLNSAAARNGPRLCQMTPVVFDDTDVQGAARAHTWQPHTSLAHAVLGHTANYTHHKSAAAGQRVRRNAVV